jgi:hypothetical protein
MNELSLTIIRVAFLAVLWLFVIAARNATLMMVRDSSFIGGHALGP